MATITSNGTGGGLWSAGATWVGGVAPVDNDTVVIAAGDTVIYEADWSNAGTYPNGINGLTITGTLSLSRTTSGYLKMKAATSINGAGIFDCGTSGDPIPFAVKHTITGGAGWYIKGNDGSGMTMTAYGAEPTIKTVLLTGAESAGATRLEVDTDVTGDIWQVGDYLRIENVNKAASGEFRTIGAIDAGYIDITAGLTNAKIAGAVVNLLTRNVRIVGVGGAYVKSFASGKLTIGGGEWTADNRVMCESCAGVTISGGTFGYHSTVLSPGTNCTISGGVFTIGSVIKDNSGSIITGGHFSGIGNIFSGGNGAIITGGIFKGCNNIFSSIPGSSILGGTFSGNEYIAQTSAGVSILGGAFSGNKTVLNGSSAIIKNSALSSNTYDVNASQFSAFNVLFGSTAENNQYAALSKYTYSESVDHDQVAGAYKAWTKGGVTILQTTTKPTGHASSMLTVLENAAAEGYWQREFTVAAGETVSVEVQLRKNASMAYLPRVYLMNSIENPLVDATAAEDSFTMTDSTDTWESDTFSIDNSAGTTDKDYTLWFVGKNATGNVYSAYKITTQGGGTSSVKILPFTGKVGL